MTTKSLISGLAMVALVFSAQRVDGRIRAIYIVRNPDKLRGFLEHRH